MHLKVICGEWDVSMEMDKTLLCINIHRLTHFSWGEMAHFQTNTSPVHYSETLDLCLCTHTITTNTLPHKHTCIYACLLSGILEKSKSLCGDGLEWDYRTNVSSANVARNYNVGLWFLNSLTLQQLLHYFKIMREFNKTCQKLIKIKHRINKN